MARHCDQRAFQSPGYVFHKSSFAATGGAFEQHRYTVVISCFKDLNFFSLSRVERLLRNIFCLYGWLIHDGLVRFFVPRFAYRCILVFRKHSLAGVADKSTSIRDSV